MSRLHTPPRARLLPIALCAALVAVTGCDDASPNTSADTSPASDTDTQVDTALDTSLSIDTVSDEDTVQVDTHGEDAVDVADAGDALDVEHDSSDVDVLDTSVTTDVADVPDSDADADMVDPPPPPHFELTCDPPPTGVTAEVVAGWVQARDAGFDAAGHPATANLQGLPGALHGALRVDLDHAVRLDSNADYLYVTDAVVAEHGTGTLELRTNEPAQFAGGEIVFEHFTATGILARDAVIDPVAGLEFSGEASPTQGEVPNLRANTADLAVTWPHPGSGMPGTVGELRIDDLYTRQIFYDDGTAISVPQDPMAQPVVEVASGSGLYLWPSAYDRYTFEYEGTPTLPGAMAIHVTPDDLFSAAGAFGSGALDVPAVGFSGPVSAFFGRGGTLHYDDSGVLVSDGTFRLTQAIDAAGPLLPAHLELAPTEVVIQVPQGESRIVAIHYRESSFEGDALLGAVDFTTDAPDETIQFELRSRTEWFRWTQYAIFGNDPLWAKPVLLVAGVITDTIATVGQVLGCVFTFGFGCDFPDSPDLERFPGHIPAGELGMFEVYVEGNGEVGEQYTATLTYTGQNYCAATVTFAIEIAPPCSVEPADFCTESMVECGSYTGTDSCGLERTESCGGCGSGQVCDQNQCCTPWSNSELCDQNGADCGNITATDNCGTQRSINCGGCPALLSCGSNNTCGL